MFFEGMACHCVPNTFPHLPETTSLVQSGCQSNVQPDGGARAGAVAGNIPDNWGDLQSSPSIANCMHECRMTCTFCQRVELPSGEAPIGKVSVWEETVSNKMTAEDILVSNSKFK